MTNKSNQKHIDTAFIGHPKPLFSLSMTEVWIISLVTFSRNDETFYINKDESVKNQKHKF